MRIVSLVPSVTETLVALGHAPVACTRYCRQAEIRQVGGTKTPDLRAIVSLRPDLVLLDTEENRREDCEALVSAGLAVHVLHVRGIEEVDGAMRDVARLVGATWVPFSLPESSAVFARGFVPIWRRPWMALGMPTYGASLLRHLGIDTVFAEDGPYPVVNLEEAKTRCPDLTLAPSEPYPFSVRQLPELESVAPTVFVDGRDLFWWGIRTPSALERLALVLERAVRW